MATLKELLIKFGMFLTFGGLIGFMIYMYSVIFGFIKEDQRIILVFLIMFLTSMIISLTCEYRKTIDSYKNIFNIFNIFK
jgi:hypothetical protein